MALKPNRSDIRKQVAYQEVEYTEAKHVKGNTHMAVIVEPAQHSNAEAEEGM